MKTYTAAIVGLSGIAARRARPDAEGLYPHPMPASHAASYAHHPQTRVIAGCDLKREFLDEFTATWGDVWPEARVYTDFREMLTAQRPDILSVVTSDHAHAQIVVDACRAGVPAIFCEKPIATTLEDADRMIAAAEESGTVLSIDHTRRWRPLWRMARQRLLDGAIGELQTITATMASPRAMLFRNGTHLIDMVRYFAGARPEWVFAALEPGFETYGVYGGDGGRNAALEPGVQGFIQFENGVRGLVNLHKTGAHPFTIELLGSTGRMLIGDPRGASLYVGATEERLYPPDAALANIPGGIAEIVRILDGSGETVSSTPDEARDVLAILLGFLKSQVAGNARIEISAASE